MKPRSADAADPRPVWQAMRRVAALAGLAALAGSAAAQEWSVENSMQTRLESNDNYQLLASPHGTVNQWQLSDSVGALRRTESVSTRIDANLTAVTLKGEDAGRNRVDGSISLDQSFTDQRDTFDFKLGYVRDTTFDNELGATGVLLARGRRNSSNAAATWTHALTERLNAGLSVSASDVRYQHEVNGGVNYDYASAVASMGYLLEETTSLSLQASHSDYRTHDGSTRSTTDSANVSLVHAFSERNTASFGVGLYHSDTVSPQVVLVCPVPALFCQIGLAAYVAEVKPVAFANRGSQYSAGWKYKYGENTDVELHASRAVVPSGASVLLQTDSASASLAHAFSPTLRMGADFSESRSRYLGVTTPSRPRYQTLGVFVSKALDIDLSFEAGYRHALSDDVTSARSNLVYATLKYDWPKLASSH